MNYYQHHIGDFDKATRHLTRIERSIYRDLIELYYDTEQPLTLDRAALCRKIIARSNEEVTAVEQTLNEFFTETPTGWVHERCEHELERYHNCSSQKALAGKASALKRQAKKQDTLNGNSTPVEQPLTDVEHTMNVRATNQEPITINQEPTLSMSGLQANADPSPVIRLNGKKIMVEEVLTYLNLQARRNYRLTNPNGTLTAGAEVIAKRLKEGYTVQQCKDVIGEKSIAWMGDEKMDQYLNPQTLFRKSNFDRYLAEAEAN